MDDEPDEFPGEVSGAHLDSESRHADWRHNIPEFSLGMEEGRSW
jgi:hypothetical protein